MLNQRAGVCVPAERPTAGGDRHRGESVTQQTVARGMNSALVSARGAAPEFAVRFAGALMAVAVAAVHVADQGGITVMADPAWIGWGDRLLEVGGGLAALILLLPQAGLARARLAGLGGGRTAGRRAAPRLYRHTHRGLARRPGRHRQLGRLAGHGVAAGRGRAGDAQRQHAPGGTAAAVTRGVRRYDWRHHRAAQCWRRSWGGRGYLLTGSSSVSSRPGFVLARGDDPLDPPVAGGPGEFAPGALTAAARAGRGRGERSPVSATPKPRIATPVITARAGR